MENTELQPDNTSISKNFISFFIFAIINIFIFKLIINYAEFFKNFISALTLEIIFLTIIFLFDEAFLYKIHKAYQRYLSYYLFAGILGLGLLEIIINTNYQSGIFGICLLFLFRASVPTFAFLLSDKSLDKFYRHYLIEKTLILYAFFVFIGFFFYFIFDSLFILQLILIIFIITLNIFLLKKIYDLK